MEEQLKKLSLPAMREYGKDAGAIWTGRDPGAAT